jgi:ABC-type multidrug transport system ATPase subunit
MSGAVIRTRGLSKRYGRTTALANLELEVPRGAVFGLLGPNGAGKSTTFGILCGWLRADAGEATVLDTKSHELSRLSGKVSAMPQDAAFPPQVSVEQQLRFYGRLGGLLASEAEKEAKRVLSLVELADAAGRRGNQLSHGMLKRVALAQALLGKPEVIFLDEPTAGLDPATARHIKDVIAAQAPRATVVVSSHNLAEIQEICTHGAILDKGQQVAAGTIAELTRSGTEITIELGPNAQVPLDALAARFGAESVALLDAQTLRIVSPSTTDVAQVISGALRVLLEHETPILGVRRGTSLERAFLEATRREPKV